MRAFIVSILVFALAGAAISGLLLYQHYAPDTQFGMYACGSEFINPCRVLARSGFDSVLGFPIAGLGLVAYLFVIIAIALTMISGESRYPLCWAALLPVALLSVVVDIVLGSVLIHLGLACRLCILTYAVNILICISLFLWYLRMEEDSRVLGDLYRDLASFLRGSDNRPLVASFTLIMIFMFLFILFFSAYLNIRSGEDESQQSDIARFKRYYYSLPREEISLPESSMAIGDADAEIRIAVFTDFLCSACHRLYEAEKSILARFWPHVRIDYYCFPLDGACNVYAPETTYPNSCVAAMAFIVAGQRGFFRDLLEHHYENYRDHMAAFHRGNATASIKDYFPASSPVRYDAFMQEALSERIKFALNDDVKLGAGLAVRAVPTIFINGRRLEGVPDPVLLEAVISELLETGRH